MDSRRGVALMYQFSNKYIRCAVACVDPRHHAALHTEVHSLGAKPRFIIRYGTVLCEHKPRADAA
jgi:hypothetical protein